MTDDLMSICIQVKEDFDGVINHTVIADNLKQTTREQALIKKAIQALYGIFKQEEEETAQLDLPL